MLFATLDPTMRAIDLGGGKRAILSDTVGFISDLPTQLVAAFRATLEEVVEADLILHVRDVAHPETAHQAENVREILADIGVGEADEERIIEVWNKIDTLSPEAAASLRQSASRLPRTVVLSALTGQGVDAMLEAINAALSEPVREETLDLPFDQGRKRAWLFDHKLVLGERQTDTGYKVEVRWSDRDRRQYSAL
jgi:GTP-binding protein HflX